MKKIKLLAVASLMIGFTVTTGLISLGQGDDRGVEKRRQEALLKYPLPKNNIQLKLVKSFPDEDQIGQDIYLKGAMGLCVDDFKNLIYVCDNEDHKIMVFDTNGRFVKKIGQFGQGPADFFRPMSVMLWQDYIVVNDVGNLRVEFLDKNGKYMRGFSTFKTYTDLVINKDGIIYGAHINKYNEPNTCDALSAEGKHLFSFGKKLDIQSKFGLNTFMNMKLFLDSQGNIYLAYLDFAVIRKYSKKGKLLKELSLNSARMNDIKKLNEERAKSKSTRSMSSQCFKDFWVDNEKIYCIFYSPRLEIVEFNDKGEVLTVFWNDEVNGYLLFDFWIGREKEKFVFYVARVLPDRGIDIFKY